MAVAAVGFARDLPDDARLLLTIRPGDLLDDEPDAAFQADARRDERPADRADRGAGPAAVWEQQAAVVDAVARAVADLPYAVVRRHARDDPMPTWLENDVAASALAVLRSFGERP